MKDLTIIAKMLKGVITDALLLMGELREAPGSSLLALYSQISENTAAAVLMISSFICVCNLLRMLVLHKQLC